MACAQVGGPPRLLPAHRFGLEVVQEGEATTFRRADLRFAYVPGLGWTPPLEAGLPPPEGGRLPLEVVRAAGLVEAPEAGVRYSADGRRLRLVLDLPAPPAELPTAELGPYPRRLELRLPYFLPGLEEVRPSGVELDFRYEKEGTWLTLTAPPGRFYRYRAFGLRDPSRYVLDVYYLEPEREEEVALGFRYRELWVWAPEPVRMYTLQALPDRWHMEPVGRPGERRVLPEMAPGALALLNGGYFDGRTATPIGLWVRGGVPLSFPYGRSTLFWEGGSVFAGRAQFAAWVELPDGRRVQVGLNLARARYTAHTLPGPVGRVGEGVHLVQGERVVATLPAPAELPEGHWALSFPLSEPLARTGERIRLLVRLEPAVSYALEAGPLLIQSGANVFSPTAEPFRDRAPVEAVAAQSAVAWTQDGALTFIVTEPMRPEALARVLQEMGFWGAIRMDGGGSAQLWVRGQLKNPNGGPLGPRPVVSGLALYPR
ncbi:MAG: phosphodiester glycosidase family protein [Meiothermus sp.]|uniref:phosphodiester glycosidase family protein n=1 Tax=Meiothermus sp. TaxID=1955249 RepID=UPI0025D0CC9B|nr:phosphodiester glycosidase family protein [Meiothermus sp.]MCS7058850.1 phosphodiester glycosidase family protein [Meiothermus sp.]MCS7194550.1 phosphodiester glycosidase family protein [Meiothermus sp.]MCX7740348.1 phosphodiester glycosidase family protein [Meiothermus sp.]